MAETAPEKPIVRMTVPDTTVITADGKETAIFRVRVFREGDEDPTILLRNDSNFDKFYTEHSNVEIPDSYPASNEQAVTEPMLTLRRAQFEKFVQQCLGVPEIAEGQEFGRFLAMTEEDIKENTPPEPVEAVDTKPKDKKTLAEEKKRKLMHLKEEKRLKLLREKQEREDRARKAKEDRLARAKSQVMLKQKKEAELKARQDAAFKEEQERKAKEAAEKKVKEEGGEPVDIEHEEAVVAPISSKEEDQKEAAPPVEGAKPAEAATASTSAEPGPSAAATSVENASDASVPAPAEAVTPVEASSSPEPAAAPSPTTAVSRTTPSVVEERTGLIDPAMVCAGIEPYRVTSAYEATRDEGTVTLEKNSVVVVKEKDLETGWWISWTVHGLLWIPGDFVSEIAGTNVYARVTSPWDGGEGQLSIVAGDMVRVSVDEGDGWACVVLNREREGWVPSAFYQRVTQLEAYEENVKEWPPVPPEVLEESRRFANAAVHVEAPKKAPPRVPPTKKPSIKDDQAAADAAAAAAAAEEELRRKREQEKEEEERRERERLEKEKREEEERLREEKRKEEEKLKKEREEEKRKEAQRQEAERKAKELEEKERIEQVMRERKAKEEAERKMNEELQRKGQSERERRIQADADRRAKQGQLLQQARELRERKARELMEKTRAPPASAPPAKPDEPKWGLILFDFTEQGEGFVCAKKGQIVQVGEDNGNGWTYSCNGEVEGWIPSGFFQPYCSVLDSKSEEGKSFLVHCICDYKAQNPSCLSIFENSIVRVEEENEKGWMFGSVEMRTKEERDRLPHGWFPATYVNRL